MISLIGHRSKIIRLIPTLVIFLFFVFQGIISFTMHTHQLPDGRLVTHSHFSDFHKQNNSTNSSHNHNDKDYLFYYLITVINSFLIASFFYRILQIFSSQVYIPNKEYLIQNFLFAILSLRAPPLMFS